MIENDFVNSTLPLQFRIVKVGVKPDWGSSILDHTHRIFAPFGKLEVRDFDGKKVPTFPAAMLLGLDESGLCEVVPFKAKKIIDPKCLLKGKLLEIIPCKLPGYLTFYVYSYDHIWGFIVQKELKEDFVVGLVPLPENISLKTLPLKKPVFTGKLVDICSPKVVPGPILTFAAAMPKKRRRKPIMRAAA